MWLWGHWFLSTLFPELIWEKSKNKHSNDTEANINMLTKKGLHYNFNSKMG